MLSSQAVDFMQAFLFSLLSLFVLAHARDTDLSAPTVGCKEVSCPYNTSNDHRILGNKTFNGIGSARIPKLHSTPRPPNPAQTIPEKQRDPAPTSSTRSVLT